MSIEGSGELESSGRVPRVPKTNPQRPDKAESPQTPARGEGEDTVSISDNSAAIHSATSGIAKFASDDRDGRFDFIQTTGRRLTGEK
jgi:hypothetical protein